MNKEQQYKIEIALLNRMIKEHQRDLKRKRKGIDQKVLRAADQYFVDMLKVWKDLLKEDN